MGYVPDRDINFNNRVMRTAMGYCNEKKLDYTITSLDAQKAYDKHDACQNKNQRHCPQ